MVRHERKKEEWVENLRYGTHYDEFIGGIKHITDSELHYRFILLDKTGECEAQITKEGCDAFDEGIYVMSLNVKLDHGKKVCIVRSMKKAVEGKDAFSPMDIYVGLSEEKISQYKQVVKGTAGMVLKWEKEHDGGAGYGKLLMLYFTQEEIDVLSKRPASVAGCGRYAGGALALVAGVSTLTRLIRQQTEVLANGLYPMDTDYPLMLTACLLAMAGMKNYVGEDMNKTQQGEIRGYVSLLQSRIEPLIEQAEIDPVNADKLINTLQCMFPGVGSLKAITIEGSVCRQALALYSEMDMCAAYLSEAPGEDDMKRGYRYSQTLKRPFLVFPERKEEAYGA